MNPLIRFRQQGNAAMTDEIIKIEVKSILSIVQKESITQQHTEKDHRLFRRHKENSLSRIHSEANLYFRERHSISNFFQHLFESKFQNVNL